MSQSTDAVHLPEQLSFGSRTSSIGSADDVESALGCVVPTLMVLSEVTVLGDKEQNSSKSLQQSPKIMQSGVQKHIKPESQSSPQRSRQLLCEDPSDRGKDGLVAPVDTATLSGSAVVVDVRFIRSSESTVSVTVGAAVGDV